LFQEAARLKAEGNELFRTDKFAEAADKYSKAIEADSTEAALYSNRAACYASLDMWPEVSTIKFS
jgi:Flp pilus assembly protein TadD